MSIKFKELADKKWVESQYYTLGKSSYKIAQELGCTDANVLRAMRKLGVKRIDRKWSDVEIDRLFALSKKKPFTKIAKILGRSYPSVRGKVITMGIASCYSPSRETKKFKVRKRISSSLQNIPLNKWNGFKEPINALIRKSVPYKSWRQQVFRRDGYSCVICGAKSGKGIKIEADHIKPFSTHPKLRMELGNGRTLCRQCHEKTDTWGNKALKAKP